MKTYILIFIISLSFITSCISDKHSGTPLVVTPSLILHDLRQNRSESDRKYKGKPILITGKIDTIFTESPLTIFFPIEGRLAVIANFPESEREKLVKLRQGQEVSLLCLGNGSFVDAKGDAYVNVLDCEIKNGI